MPITLSAPTLAELIALVRKYYHNYHPAGYGTKFFTGGLGWGERRYLSDDDIWGDNPLSKLTPLEDGTFEVYVSRASHCD